jgi:hypothetical protein
LKKLQIYYILLHRETTTFEHREEFQVNKSILIFLSILLVILSIENVHSRKLYKEAQAIGPLTVISSEANVGKLDPFFGGQFSYITTKTKFSFDLTYSKAKERFGAGTEIEADDFLYGVMVDYLFGKFPNDRLIGPYVRAGGGYYRENIKFSGTLFGQNFEYDLSASTFAIEGIAGILFRNGEIWAAYTTYPNSDNVTAALRLGVSFFAGGK